MANLLINGQTYNGVNKVKIPNTNSGQEEFIQPTGTKQISTNGTHNVSDYANAEVNVQGGGATLQSKTVTPTENTQNVGPDSGYDGLSGVTVNPIPSNYIIPTGSLSISENGTFDVSAYASAIVSVAGGGSGITNIYQGIAFPSSITTLNISFDSSLGTPVAIITWSESAYNANRTCGHITFCDMYHLNGIYGTFATALYNDPTNGLVMAQLSHKARGANGEYVFDRATTSNSFSTSDEFNYIVFFKPVGNLSFDGGGQ